jgi:hypothetical protein
MCCRPQVLENAARRSVDGLSVDYLVYRCVCSGYRCVCRSVGLDA